MGPRAVVNYNPSLAHPQMGYAPGIPVEELLQPFCYSHEEGYESTSNEISRAWTMIKFKGKAELGKDKQGNTGEFRAWLTQRTISRGFSPQSPLNPLQGNMLKDIEKALKKKIEDHKDELDNLESLKKKQKKEIEESQREYVALSEDIRKLKHGQEENMRLKEELADALQAKEALELQARNSRRLEDERQFDILLLRKKLAEMEANEVDYAEALERRDRAEKELESVVVANEILRKRRLSDLGEIEKLAEAVTHWRREVSNLRDGQSRIAGVIASAIPRIADSLEKAERKAFNIQTPEEINQFLALGRYLVNRWNRMNHV